MKVIAVGIFLCQEMIPSTPFQASGYLNINRIYSYSYSVGQSSSWEANGCSAAQEILSILQNPEANYQVYKSLSPGPVLGKISPVHIIPSYFFNIYFNIILLYLGLQSGLFPSDFIPKFHIYFFSPTCVLNALSISSSLIWSFWQHLEYKLWSSS
jgi:hypothetical protein